MHFARLAALAALLAVPVAAPARADAPAHPECAAYSATVYFETGAVSLPASASPLLHEAADRIAACRAAGGRLRRVTVTPRADGVAPDARAIVRARGEVLRKALVEVGVPRRAIRVERPAARDGDPMQRRTEFAVEME